MANRVLCQNRNMFAAFCRFFRCLVPGFCAQWQNGKSRQQTSSVCCRLFGALAGTRIPDPLIKSQLLYRLSYKRIYCLQLINYTSQASFCQPLFSHFLRFAPGFPRAGKRQDGGRKFSPASAAKIWNCAGRHGIIQCWLCPAQQKFPRIPGGAHAAVGRPCAQGSTGL